MMTDISFCGNSEQCPTREKCWRNFMPNDGGYYSVVSFYEEDQKECNYFYPFTPESK